MNMKLGMLCLVVLGLLVNMSFATFYQIQGTIRNASGPSEGYSIGGGYFGPQPMLDSLKVLDSYPADAFGSPAMQSDCPKENGVPICQL